ncbi:uncharacterized protein [Typha angustifolia]|uniref:uncharacterized protein n=1 Tax=Typha angustifolia TaxID=59011 RepID=UPI003C2EA057
MTEITLRPFDLSDADDFMVWASDEKVSAFCSWDAYTDKSDLLKYMADSVLPHPWLRAICLDSRPIGAISLTPVPSGGRHRAELGYVLASAHWGRGIVSEAVRMALGRAFADVAGLERVEALVDPENKASQRVLEKVGFVREGVLRKYWFMKGKTRDMVSYSFLATDTIIR